MSCVEAWIQVQDITKKTNDEIHLKYSLHTEAKPTPRTFTGIFVRTHPMYKVMPWMWYSTRVDPKLNEICPRYGVVHEPTQSGVLYIRKVLKKDAKSITLVFGVQTKFNEHGPIGPVHVRTQTFPSTHSLYKATKGTWWNTQVYSKTFQVYRNPRYNMATQITPLPPWWPKPKEGFVAFGGTTKGASWMKPVIIGGIAVLLAALAWLWRSKLLKIVKRAR